MLLLAVLVVVALSGGMLAVSWPAYAGSSGVRLAAAAYAVVVGAGGARIVSN